MDADGNRDMAGTSSNASQAGKGDMAGASSNASQAGTAGLPYDQRPPDATPRHTADLPATPLRDRAIPASAWLEAPDSLLKLGEDLPGNPEGEYKRRIGPWLLWRAGPASRGHARYWAALADDLATAYTFRLHPDGTGDGVGPSGTRHSRFRTWKEDLRDHR